MNLSFLRIEIAVFPKTSNLQFGIVILNFRFKALSDIVCINYGIFFSLSTPRLHDSDFPARAPPIFVCTTNFALLEHVLTPENGFGLYFTEPFKFASQDSKYQWFTAELQTQHSLWVSTTKHCQNKNQYVHLMPRLGTSTRRYLTIYRISGETSCISCWY